MDKKLSVIVTVYNTEETYLRKCIESIMNQSLKEIEIILVNDGSKQEVQSICEQYAKEDDRIRLINQPNQGESVARNVGMEHTKTEHIVFVDSDDWIEYNMCETIMKYILELQGQYDILVFHSFVDYINKSIKNKFYNKEGLLTKADIEQIQLQSIEKGISKYYPIEANISVVWAKVYHKKFLEEHHLQFIPNIIRMTDAIFNMEAFEKANNIYVIPEYLYHYQKNEFAICQRYSKDTISYYETYIKHLKEQIKTYQKGSNFQEILNIKIVTSIDKYMYNYFFHQDNPKSYQETKKEMKKLLEKELYQTALKEVKMKYLGIYQKCIVLACRKKNIELLYCLKKGKDKIKSLQRKSLLQIK